MRIGFLLWTMVTTFGGYAWCGEVTNGHETGSVVSSWRGGALTLERFIAVYDPELRALDAGGDYLREAVCKATVREIYSDRARRTGIDRSPEYLAELERWRQGRLASLFVERNRPDLDSLLTDEALHEYYERSKADRYTSSGSVDLDVLFIRCAGGAGDESECRHRMDDALERLEAGVELASLIEQERALSGNANGVFPKLAMKTLAPDLAAIVRELPIGEISPVIETSIGLYLIRVSQRRPPGVLPFERVERHVRQELSKELLAGWRDDEIARQRVALKDWLPAEAEPEEVLATAAEAGELDTDPEFVAAERNWTSWELVDRGLYADEEIMPSDDEIRRRLERDPIVSLMFRRYSLEAVVIRATKDRSEMLGTVEEVSRALESTDDPAEVLRSFGGGDPGVERVPLEGVTRDEMRRLDRHIARCLESTEAGGWCGPWPIPTAREVPEAMRDRVEAGALPSGVAFVAIEGWRTPRLEEVREDYNRYFRSTIAGCDLFLAAAGERWGLRLTPPSTVPPMAVGEP